MPGDEPSTLELAGPAGAEPQARVTSIRWLGSAARSATIIDRARLTIGRSAEADVRLEAAGVSRRHAEIFHRGTVTAIADAGSKNGVFVNGRAITHTALMVGDVIRLGDALGVVEVLVPAAGTPSAVLDAVGPGMAHALRDLTFIATSTLPVIVVGETGVGKERAAVAIHRASARRGSLHSVNCAAIPENLAEAELFGHRRGAFTGAEHSGLGHFRAADKGTLLLDELQDLPLKVQAVLLRVLQDGLVAPLGETSAVPVDVRVVAAVQRPPDELVRDGRLRPDLAMRLSGFVLRLPPLRERRADIGALFHHFIDRYGGGASMEVEAPCLEALLMYEWPGNVRELELLTRRLIALAEKDRIIRWLMLPEEVRSARPACDSSGLIVGETRQQHDQRALRAALRAEEANVARAAKRLGMSRQRAYRLMEGKTPAEFVGGAHVPNGSSPPPREKA